MQNYAWPTGEGFVFSRLCRGRMTEVEDFLKGRYSENDRAYRYYEALYREYAASGLADATFDLQLTSGDEDRFWQRTWEMLLARHLRKQGHQLYSDEAGPDFRFTFDDKIIHCEAIAPTAAGLPTEWLTPPGDDKFVVRMYPHEEILLRWTSAIKKKRDKLLGHIDRHGKYHRGYLETGHVAPDQPYVIAVNGCLLTDAPVCDGISGLHSAVEAVFPVGPFKIPVSRDGALGKARRSYRPSIMKPNGSPISTDFFLDPCNRAVSAVLGCCRKDDLNGLHPIVIHNPLAVSPLPHHALGAATEYVPHDTGEAYELIDVAELGS